MHRVFTGYGPRIIQNSAGGYVVRIQNSTDLCRDFAPWPSFARDRFDASTIDEARLVCPQCGGRFRTGTHLCEYVEDGAVVRKEDASPRGSCEDERYIEWSREDCVVALREEYGGRDVFPSNAEYDRIQRGRAELPSIATLYRRFGCRDEWLQELSY